MREIVDHHPDPGPVRAVQPEHPGGGEDAQRRPALGLDREDDLCAIMHRRDVHRLPDRGSGDGDRGAAGRNIAQLVDAEAPLLVEQVVGKDVLEWLPTALGDAVQLLQQVRNVLLDGRQERCPRQEAINVDRCISTLPLQVGAPAV